MVEYDKGTGRHRISGPSNPIGLATTIVVQTMFGPYVRTFDKPRECTVSNTMRRTDGRHRRGVSLAKV